MRAMTAIGIDDDLASRQTAVAHRASDNETAGRIDIEFGFESRYCGGDRFFDDLLDQRFMDLLMREFSSCWELTTTASTRFRFRFRIRS